MRIAGVIMRSRAQYLAAASLFDEHPLLSRSLGSAKTHIQVSACLTQSTITYNILRPTPGCERAYHDGRPRGPLWRGKKQIGKEAMFVILGMKRFKDDTEKLDKFIKTHVVRLVKMDMIAVLNELERQGEMFRVIRKQDWYKPDVYLYKDLIVAFARRKKMDDAMNLWKNMREEDLFPDSQTYTEVIRGFLQYGSPADAMNIYEDMKKISRST